MPSGAMNSVPATIAQVVVTSGEWRRRIRAPNDRVDGPARGGAEGQHVADQRRAEVETLTGGDDERDTGERDEGADELDRVGLSAPSAIASSAVMTGVVAMSSAESPAGMVWSATGQRIW